MQDMEEISGLKSGMVFGEVRPLGRYGKRENFCHFAILPFGRVPAYDRHSLAIYALEAPKGFAILPFSVPHPSGFVFGSRAARPASIGVCVRRILLFLF